MNIPDFSKRVRELDARRKQLLKERDSENIELQTIKGKLTSFQEAQLAFQTIAEEIQNQAHERIAAVVSRCLQDIFGDGAYEFLVKFEKKRGKTEAKFVFSRNGAELDPLAATGGGVVDVVAFALRLAALRLSRPSPRSLLILDEPFKHLSESYRQSIGEMLRRLSEELEIQIVLVTHMPEIATGTVYEL
jgi:DNA repair exonuclease SbcCD ATPase subunit